MDPITPPVPIALALAVLEIFGRTPKVELSGHRDEARDHS